MQPEAFLSAGGSEPQEPGAITAAALCGTKWVARPPAGDDAAGADSLAEYTFERDGRCHWALDDEDSCEHRGEGTWGVGAESVVVDLAALRSRADPDLGGAWAVQPPQQCGSSHRQ